MPQSVAGISRCGGRWASAARMRAATVRRLRLGLAHADHAKDHGFVAEAVEGRKIEIGLGGFDRNLVDL